MDHVYVLYRYWDTPDNEGNEVMGAYRNAEKAMADMKADAAATKACYPADFWEDDFTWENEREIHLGQGSDIYGPATIYCWTIDNVEVQ